jgi:hypothetical protein
MIFGIYRPDRITLENLIDGKYLGFYFAIPENCFSKKKILPIPEFLNN